MSTAWVSTARISTARIRDPSGPGTITGTCPSPGENAFTYGLLYEDERHRAERRPADARKVWKRASRSRYRGWMK